MKKGFTTVNELKSAAVKKIEEIFDEENVSREGIDIKTCLNTYMNNTYSKEKGKFDKVADILSKLLASKNTEIINAIKYSK